MMEPTKSLFNGLDMDQQISDMLIAAKAAAADGHYERAFRGLSLILFRDSDCQEAHKLLCQTSYFQDKYATAIELTRSYNTLHGFDMQLQLLLARSLCRVQSFKESVIILDECLKRDPDNEEALYLISLSYVRQGAYEKSLTTTESLLKRSPTSARYLNLLVISIQKCRGLSQSHEALKNAMSAQPSLLDAERDLGYQLLSDKEYSEARLCFDLVLTVEREDTAALRGLTSTFEEEGELEKALQVLSRLCLKPDCTVADLSKRGRLLRDSGRIVEAVQQFQMAIRDDPEQIENYVFLFKCSKVKHDDENLRRLLELDTRVDLDVNQKINLYFALGCAFEDLREFDKSFEYYVRGNSLKRHTIDYNVEKVIKKIYAIKLFTPRTLDYQSDFTAGEYSDQTLSPIFIVGMPRSGSTLVEQILASHPAIVGLGEKPIIARVLAKLKNVRPHMSFPEHFNEWGASEIAFIRNEYYDEAERFISTMSDQNHKSYFTDKMLGNFRYVGVIRRAFPEARILHTVRNPIDTCLSNYTLLFKELTYTYDLGDLGRFYRAYYELMNHWQDILPESAVLEMRYEDVVCDIEGSIRRMLDHIGLGWHEECLKFNDNARPIQTASAVQVRKPLYTNSLNRWKPERSKIVTLLDALGPDLVAVGYPRYVSEP